MELTVHTNYPWYYLSQECLSTSLSAHDPMYQTKALVSIASLYLEMGDTHQAIVYYDKLLDLQKELQVKHCPAICSYQ